LAGFLAELHALEGIAGDPQTTLVLPSEGPVLRLFREQGLALPGGRR
ncbi:MAG: hypothetical protein HYU66_29345, partial [Armatimonadetes bacterium]|nr:hypothetical protein [Armatimonadota bacterium]